MKADYKNWMPRGMVMGTGVGTIAFLVLYLIFGVSSIGVRSMLHLVKNFVRAILK